MILLDCTLRDGGYYNDWAFSNSLVNDYINRISKSGVKIVELAFRFKNKNKFGKFSHLTEKNIKKLKLPENLEYALMINCKEFILNSKVDYDLIDKFFIKKSQTKISIVRLASNFSELEQSLLIGKYLFHKGYKVFLNMMQITTLDREKLNAIALKLKKNKYIDVFYIADSLGDLDKKKIKIIYEIFSKIKKPLGIHAHDNLNQALSNTLYAKKLGFKYLDSTVLGMGRGAGNTKTEELLHELKEKTNKSSKFNYEIIYKLIFSHFKKLKLKYDWGSNQFYFLSAKNQIHPTYVQNMLDDTRYSDEDILSGINLLKKFNSKKYDINILNNAIYNLPIEDKEKKLSLKRIFNKSNVDNVLIIGPGKNLKLYKKEIIKFIKKFKPLVLSINYNHIIEKKYINYFCSCNIGRFMMDIGDYIDAKKPLIFPKGLLFEKNQYLNELNIYNFGVSFKKNQFKINEKDCILPDNLSFFYSLGIAISANSNNIFLAGLDGYTKDNFNFKNIQNYLKLFKKNYFNQKIFSLTPTNYDLKTKVL